MWTICLWNKFEEKAQCETAAQECVLPRSHPVNHLRNSRLWDLPWRFTQEIYTEIYLRDLFKRITEKDFFPSLTLVDVGFLEFFFERNDTQPIPEIIYV
jgi:hypothetical protein